MKNLNVSEKSRGIILFAFNTDTVDYVRIAEQAARLIKHTLGLPTTLITEAGITSDQFDQVIYVENNLINRRFGWDNGANWRNGGRYQAYYLSPYEETILLDSDYLQLDTSLLTILDATVDYQLIHSNRNPRNILENKLNLLGLTYVWATAVTFTRSPRAKALFDLVERIQHNYVYYRKLYNIRENNFRNDFAFAIANNILNGYNLNLTQSMPWSMLTIDAPVTNIDIKDSMLVIREKATHVIPRQNIHVMDKNFLQSDLFNKFVDTICQD